MCMICPLPLIFSDHLETFSDSTNDYISYGEIDFIEASPPISNANSLLEEFSDELTRIDPIPPGDDVFDFESDLREL